MAATDIQYGGLDPVLYTPDFTFLKYVLDKKTGQYEQGLKSASSAYNSLKKDLTDPTNVEKRNQYLKDAQGQLQKIASSDLSLQQNVNFANSIFDPIATDKAFVFDAYHTARIKNELAKEDAWMSSEDPEVRKKYNSEIKEWVNRDLESLRNGKGDINNYAGVQGRSALAYVDAQDILTKAVKDQGFKYKVDSLGQPYIVTVEGGPGGKKNYRQFANEILANDKTYQTQLGVLGQNRSEKIIEEYRTNKDLAPLWANKDPKEIFADYAIKSYDEHKVQQKEYLESLNKNLVAEDADIKAALNGPDAAKYIQGSNDVANGNNSTPQAQMYLALKEKADEVNSLQGNLKELQDDYDNSFGNEKSKEEYLKNFTDKNKAAGYFANLQFKNDITRFSNIKASSVVRTTKEDRAVVDMTVAKTNAMATLNKIQDTRTDNDLNQAKFEELLRMDEATLARLNKKKVQNADGSISVIDLGTGKTTGDIKFVDLSATQIHTINALNQLRDNVTMTSAKALSNLTDNYGAFYMLQKMGLSGEKASIIRGMYTRYHNADNKKDFKPTSAENKALSEAYTAMWGFSKNNPDNTLLAQERANYGKTALTIDRLPDLLDRATTGYKSQTKEERDSKTAMAEYKANSEKLITQNNALEKGKKVVIEKLKSQIPAMFTPDGKDIIGVPDISKSLKASYIELETGMFHYNRKANLSEEDLKTIAQQYVNGSLSVTKEDGYLQGKSDTWVEGKLKFNYNGNDYKIRVPQGASTGFPLSSKDYQKNLNRINTDVPIPTFEQAAGNVAASPLFKLSGDSKQDVIDDLKQITLTNSNVYDFSSGTYTPVQVDAALQDKIRAAMTEKDNVTDITLITSSTLNGGGQAVSVTFKPIEGTGKKEAPAWAGKTFYFPINVTSSSPKIFHVFNEVNDVSEFAPFQKEGKPYTLDTFQAEGVKAILQPREPGASNGTVELWYKPYNAATKTYSDTWQKQENGLEYDLGKKTFAEYKSDIYNGFIYPYVDGTIIYNKQQQANTISSGGTVTTADGLYKTLRPY